MDQKTSRVRAGAIRAATVLLVALTGSAASADKQLEAQVSQTEELAPPHYDLVVEISGIESIAGDLRIAVFDSPATFVDEPLVSEVIPVERTTAVWSVRLPAGRYAVAVIHDEDSNGKLNTNFLGMPRERYGFSNQARGRFGAPSFKDASFELEAGTASRMVEVR
jgi:uncharacterized protein (DUF2141 family)